MKYVITLILVFFSGFSALVYQVAWQKYLAFVLGDHAKSTALVLGAFFLFMALGYFVIGKWLSRKFKDQILFYGIIEGLIGAYGFLSPSLFYWLAEHAYMSSTNPLLQLTAEFLLTLAFVGFPTFLMGGTIPVLTQGLSRRFDLSPRVHTQIYSVNTLGAFVGALTCGFILIEKLGLPLTILWTSLINVIILGVCYLLSKLTSLKDSQILSQQPEAAATVIAEVPSRLSWVLYLVSFLSGFYVFSLENILVRMTGISLGSTNYTYSIIVGCFIAAIGIGSSLLNRLEKFVRLEKSFLWIQATLLLALSGLFLLVPAWPYILSRTRNLVSTIPINFGYYWILVFLTLLLMLIVPIGLMGTNLPLIFNFLKSRKLSLAEVVGRIYAINCIGCFLGAVVGGYFLFRYLGAATLFKVNLYLVVLTLFLLAMIIDKKQRRIALSFALIGALIVSVLPSWNHAQFIPGLYGGGNMPPSNQTFAQYIKAVRSPYEVLWSTFDTDSLVGVIRDKNDDSLSLVINGRLDANTKMDHVTRALNMVIPLVVSPNPENLFVVGFGTGMSTGIASLFEEVKSIEVVEMSQGVLAAAPFFDEHAYQLSKRMNRVQLTNGDAYRVLQERQNKKYQVIVSEPSNPWVAGVEKLFSQNFLEVVKSHLDQKGIYCQWFPLFNMDEDIFLTILKTFQEVFPWVSVWSTVGSALMIMAGHERPAVNPELIQKRFQAQSKVFTDLGWSSGAAVLSRQMITHAVARTLPLSSTPIHSLEHPRLSYAAARAWFPNFTVRLEGVLQNLSFNYSWQNIQAEKFLFEDLEVLPNDFYANASQFSIKNDRGDIFNPHEGLRLRLKLLEARAQAETLRSSVVRQRLSEYEALMGRGKPKLDLAIRKPKELDRGGHTVTPTTRRPQDPAVALVERYKRAKAAFLPVKGTALLELLRDQCQFETCTEAKLLALRATHLAKPHELDQLERSKSSLSQTERAQKVDDLLLQSIKVQ